MIQLEMNYFQDGFTPFRLGFFRKQILSDLKAIFMFYVKLSPRCRIQLAEGNARTERCVPCQNRVSTRCQKHLIQNVFWTKYSDLLFRSDRSKRYIFVQLGHKTKPTTPR